MSLLIAKWSGLSEEAKKIWAIRDLIQFIGVTTHLKVLEVDNYGIDTSCAVDGTEYIFSKEKEMDELLAEVAQSESRKLGGSKKVQGSIHLLEKIFSIFIARKIYRAIDNIEKEKYIKEDLDNVVDAYIELRKINYNSKELVAFDEIPKGGFIFEAPLSLRYATYTCMMYANRWAVRTGGSPCFAIEEAVQNLLEESSDFYDSNIYLSARLYHSLEKPPSCLVPTWVLDYAETEMNGTELGFYVQLIKIEQIRIELSSLFLKKKYSNESLKYEETKFLEDLYATNNNFLTRRLRKLLKDYTFAKDGFFCKCKKGS